MLHTPRQKEGDAALSVRLDTFSSLIVVLFLYLMRLLIARKASAAGDNQSEEGRDDRALLDGILTLEAQSRRLPARTGGRGVRGVKISYGALADPVE